MRKTLALFLFLFCFSLHTFGQIQTKRSARNHYTFQGKIYLKAVPSTWSVQQTDTANAGKNTLLIKVKDPAGNNEIFAQVSIQNAKKDTLVLTDDKGYARVNLPAGKIQVAYRGLEYTSVCTDTIVLQTNQKTCVTFHLNPSNALMIGHVYSKRHLQKAEMEKLTDDLSFGRKNELIENKTCTVSWEI